MEFYNLEFFGLKRKLPIVPISPKIKIASISLLGDVELTEKATEKLAKKLKKCEFDFLVGPEVKVVPLLFSLSQKMNKKRFIVCRKSIKGYMVSPQVSTLTANPNDAKLVLDGPDARLIKNKKVIIVDDVVSSGKTIDNLEKLLKQVGAEIVLTVAIFKQGGQYQKPLFFLSPLPVFLK